MATYHTVDGQSYSVTADGAEVTVSNASGLNQTVKAGTQYSFVGNGGDVTVSGPHHFVQLKAPFGSGGGNGGGGGGGGDVYKARDNDFTGTNTFAGGTVFTGPVTLDTDLEIGNASYGEHAEWLLYLGDPRHQGELHEETTGIVCSKGPDVHHTVDDILEALNVQSQFRDIITATKVSDFVVKLTANEAGEGPNSYRFYGEDGSDPEHPVDNPCFGLGGVGIVQTVIGSSTTVSATTYTSERNGDAMLALPDVDQEVRMYSPWPVSSGSVAREVDALEAGIRTKQDALTFDKYPKYMSSNPVKSSGLYPTPYNVVRGGVISFDESPDPMDPGNPKCFMHPNTLYIVWDNDLDDRSVVAVLPDNLMPDYFTTAELHIFNHQSTPISLKWPAGWHWYDVISDSYKKDADGHVYSPVLTGNSCMCVVVRCSVFGSTHFEPTVTVDPFVMAKVAYVHQMHDEEPVEKV